MILFLKPQKYRGKKWSHVSHFSPNSSLLGSQCFLSVSALSGMLFPPTWACLRSCLGTGLGCVISYAISAVV